MSISVGEWTLLYQFVVQYKIRYSCDSNIASPFIQQSATLQVLFSLLVDSPFVWKKRRRRERNSLTHPKQYLSSCANNIYCYSYTGHDTPHTLPTNIQTKGPSCAMRIVTLPSNCCNLQIDSIFHTRSVAYYSKYPCWATPKCVKSLNSGSAAFKACNVTLTFCSLLSISFPIPFYSRRSKVKRSRRGIPEKRVWLVIRYCLQFYDS